VNNVTITNNCVTLYFNLVISFRTFIHVNNLMKKLLNCLTMSGVAIIEISGIDLWQTDSI
jgi:hypothetical protein